LLDCFVDYAPRNDEEWTQWRTMLTRRAQAAFVIAIASPLTLFAMTKRSLRVYRLLRRSKRRIAAPLKGRPFMASMKKKRGWPAFLTMEGLSIRIQAVAFDIGQTLVHYNNPLNWAALYAPALRRVLEGLGLSATEERIEAASAVLRRYNTRENPREVEFSSETIFRGIFDAWHQPSGAISSAKEAFYGFFQAGAAVYDDAPPALAFLRARGVRIGALTDVAYGMDDALSLKDIEPIRDCFDLVLSSVAVGFRKPNPAGYLRLLKAFACAPEGMLFVGDEKKDILGANALGIGSVLLDREKSRADFGQTHTISSLAELQGLISP
jgi:putative hydrolase of the HAD superfamily